MSREEREHWEAFRASSAEILLDTVYLALATGCIAGLRFEAHYFLGANFVVVPSLLTLDDTFTFAHALAIAKWMLNSIMRAMRHHAKARK